MGRLAVCALAMTAALALPTSAAEATTPGRNGLIAFTLETGDSSQLYTLDPLTHRLDQLTDVQGEDAINVDWSPSGRDLVYEVDAPTSFRTVSARRDGSGVRTVQPRGLTGDFGQPAFVPRSGLIVLERFDPVAGDDSLWLVGRNGAHPGRLTTNPYPGVGGDTDPNVSPDGRTVTFVRASVFDDQQALYAIDLDGTHLRQLLPYADDVAIKHDWSPDGTHIVVPVNANPGSRRDVSANVETLWPDGSHRRLLTHFSGRRQSAFVGGYSPDGRWIVYRVETGDGSGTLTDGKFGLYAIHPWGGQPRLLAALDARPRYIDWGARVGARRR